MPARDIVTVGASAGGVEALTILVSGLPPNLAAAVFVVLHTMPRGTSFLPGIFSSAGPLPASHPENDAPIEHGQIYVAPPDFHMLVDKGRIRLTKGPRENRTRPAIDPLFRSASRAYGSRVIGVVLSGMLDDGSSGLTAIKRRGGVAIVQDPDDAAFGSMPNSALRAVEADFRLPARRIAAKIAELSATTAAARTAAAKSGNGRHESEIAELDILTPQEEKLLGPASGLTCPDCNGAIWEIQDGEVLRFRCRVGHVYSSQNMVTASADATENALWAAVRALEENAALGYRLGGDAQEHGHERLATAYLRRARESDEHARELRRILGASI